MEEMVLQGLVLYCIYSYKTLCFLISYRRLVWSLHKVHRNSQKLKILFLELNLLIFCSYSTSLARYEVKKYHCVMYLF